jgi:endo-1,4-beta-xylanase
MRYCLLAAFLSIILLGACAPAQTPTSQVEISTSPASLPTAIPVEPTSLPSPTASPTETPTPVPSLTPTPISLEDWAQSNSPDQEQLQSALATYAQSMGLPLENIQTEVQMRNGVNGPFAVLVDKDTGVPFFISRADEHGTFVWQVATLDNLAQERDLRFGALLNLNRDFRSITLDNFGTGNAYIGWSLVQPQKGVWDFSDPGYNIDLAYKNGLSVMANLIWGNNVADWVRQEPDLQAVMRDYITQVMTHYKGKVTIWNVYNEAKWHGDGDVFWNQLGGIEAVRDAFATARAADPNAILLYNDYVDLDNTNNQDRFPIFESVMSQIYQDGNLDGIATQVIARTESFDPAKLRAILDELSKYDLPIYVEEFSILINGENTPQNMAKQAQVASEVIKILREYDNVVEVIAFPLEDRIANIIYLPNSNSGLWLKTDKGYIPKPVVYMMMEALATDK